MQSRHIQNSRGFTLLELALVLAIIAILAVIAIPQYTGMRRAYKERTVVSYLHQIGMAANNYKTTSGNKRYPLYLHELYAKQPGQTKSYIPEPDEEDDWDSVFVSDWYVTWLYSGGENTFVCTATPNDTSNHRRLAVYEDGVVRYTTDGTTPQRTSPAVK